MKLAFMTNDSARKSCFKRRMQGMKKKLTELTTLCGIDACAIVYSPNNPQAEVWPNSMGVYNVLAQFLRTPDIKRYRNMVTLEGYIRERVEKAEKKLKKKIKKNRKQEMTEMMYQCLIGDTPLDSLCMKNLNDLGLLVHETRSEIDSRIESLKKADTA
ncbi:agamous-like MADS-box protein AGL80 [Tanacetum coccineum]